jgi:hypothetical protein
MASRFVVTAAYAPAETSLAAGVAETLACGSTLSQAVQVIARVCSTEARPGDPGCHTPRDSTRACVAQTPAPQLTHTAIDCC